MPPNPLRSFGFPPDMPSPLWLFPDDKPLKAQPTYTAAKAGDPEAAFEMLIGWQARLVHLLSAPALKGCMFVAPHAEEATGDNAIPQVLAAVCAAETDGEVDDEIVQVTRVFHTGADPMERMALRAEFEGAVLPGKRYVLVDDVTSMGGTLAELAHFIQQGGATVAGVVVLANAGVEGIHPIPQRCAKTGDQVWTRHRRHLWHPPRRTHRQRSALSHRISHG